MVTQPFFFLFFTFYWPDDGYLTRIRKISMTTVTLVQSKKRKRMTPSNGRPSILLPRGHIHINDKYISLWCIDPSHLCVHYFANRWRWFTGSYCFKLSEFKSCIIAVLFSEENFSQDNRLKKDHWDRIDVVSCEIKANSDRDVRIVDELTDVLWPSAVGRDICDKYFRTIERILDVPYAFVRRVDRKPCLSNKFFVDTPAKDTNHVRLY